MSSMPISSLQCHEIVEALSKCINLTRLSYEDDLNGDARNERLQQGDNRLTDLVNALDPILLNLKKDRNCYVPISRLFNELLLEIWSYTDIMDRFSISQVSHRWRQVALASTSLWTLIDLELNNTLRIRKLLERTGVAPLHIVASIKKFYNPIYKQTTFSYYNERGVQSYNAYYPVYSQSGELRKPMPFFTQKEFDDIVGRCATLDAFIGDSKAYYVTPKSLKNPMPHLRTLRLMLDQSVGYGSQDPRDPKPLTPKSIPFPAFEGHTPCLRELCFEWIHARWSDPIYNNLTNLRLFYPRKSPTIGQLVRVLSACPDLTHIELIGCLKPDIPPPMGDEAEDLNTDTSEEDAALDIVPHKAVSLPKLAFFHINDFEDDAIRDLLSCLELPCLDYLFVGAPTYACFTDKYGRPLKSLLATIQRPKELRIAAQIEYYLLYARLSDDSVVGEEHDGDVGQRSDRRFRRKLWGERNGGDRYHSQNYDDCAWDWCYSPGLAVTSRRDQQNTIQTGVPNKKAREIMSRWSATMMPIGVQLDQMVDVADDTDDADPDDTGNPQQPSAPPVNQTNTLAPVPIPIIPTLLVPPPVQEVHNIIPIIAESIDFVEVMEQVSLGGVEFHEIEKLDISDNMIFSDAAYRELFTRCRNLRKLKVSFNKGIGILQVIIKNDLLPNLTELYLVGLEGFYGYQVPVSSALLADWVESRQSAAAASAGEGGGESRIKSLEKVVVVFSNGLDPTTDEPAEETKEARKRIRKALGDQRKEKDKGGKDGITTQKLDRWKRRLVWQTPATNETKMKRKWDELVNENGYGDESGVKGGDKEGDDAVASDSGKRKDNSIGAAEGITEEDQKGQGKEDKEKLIEEVIAIEDEHKDVNDIIKVEWPMMNAMASPFRGWSAGPW